MLKRTKGSASQLLVTLAKRQLWQNLNLCLRKRLKENGVK